MPGSSPSQALVPYRGSSSLTSPSSTRSLFSSPTRLFTAQTGTAIATELLYRLLFEIIHRFLALFQQFATKQMDRFQTFLEQKMQEDRPSRTAQDASAGVEAGPDNTEGKEGKRQRRESVRTKNCEDDRQRKLNITEEVSKLAEQRGFVCPMTRSKMGGGVYGGPPMPHWKRHQHQYPQDRQNDNGLRGSRWTSGPAGPSGPPGWVGGVLEGIKEGRMHDRDFYTNTW